MKAHLEQLLFPQGEVFIHRQHRVEAYTAQHHFHPELELHLVTSGWGTGCIGDQKYAFEEGDLVLVGSMLAHHWESAPHFEETGTLASCHFLQFPEHLFGPDLAQYHAFERIAQLFQRAKKGIRFFGTTSRDAEAMLQSLAGATGMQRLTLFLELLDLLAQSLEYILLLPEDFQNPPPSSGDERMKKVFAYLHQNLTSEISLELAASEAALSKAAFCRFFKKRTLRTFSDFVNEMRIRHAIHLMAEKNVPVGQAALESGFNNLGYFHATYKKRRGKSPRADWKELGRAGS